MVRVITNNFRDKFRAYPNKHLNNRESISYQEFMMTQKAKMLAWGIFLVYFIENGTLGLVPKQMYFVYRNVRISDLLIYFLTIYSLLNIREFAELYKSKTMILAKILLCYLFFQFLISVLLYDVNMLEYFFRLKGVWSSLLIFPYLLLLKRNGLKYLIKLILPVAVVSNVLYILSSFTGVAFLPEIGIEKQSLSGGFQVFRVYGGTFYGEWLFLGFVFQWITSKIRWYQVLLIALFALPQILAFGRSAWLFYTFTIVLMTVWYTLRKREFKILIRQIFAISIFLIIVVYVFAKFVPDSSSMTDALEARVLQGQEDVKYNMGTYGTRMANIQSLVSLWLNSNVLFGIGMHPMWVIKPLTVEENIYAWGFSDTGWASVLAAYGLIGFILALIFQIYYIITTIKILRRADPKQITTFLVLLFLSKLLFDSVLNYAYAGFSFSLWGFWSLVYFMACVTYKYEHPDEQNSPNNKTG